MPRFVSIFLLMLIGLGVIGATSVSADAEVKKPPVTMTLSADPASYVVQRRTPLTIKLELSANKPGVYSGTLGVGGSWWDREFYPYKMKNKVSPNLTVTNMYCDGWGCTFYWQAKLEKNQKDADLTIYTFANNLVGHHLVATATFEGVPETLYVDALPAN